MLKLASPRPKRSAVAAGVLGAGLFSCLGWVGRHAEQDGSPLKPNYERLELTVPQGSSTTRRIVLSNDGSASISIARVDGVSASLTVSLNRKGEATPVSAGAALGFVIEPGKSGRMEVTVHSQELEYGEHSFVIVLFSPDDRELLRYPVIAFITDPVDPDADKKTTPIRTPEAAELPPPAGAEPRIKVEPYLLDLGELFVGERVTREFVLSNVGTGDLELQKLYTQCHCTIPELDMPGGKVGSRQIKKDLHLTLKPGEKGTVRFQLDTSGLLGEVRRQLVVYCNDPRQSPLPLNIVADVKDPFERSPNMAYFAEAYRSQEPEIKVHLISRTLGPFEITGYEQPMVPSGDQKVPLFDVDFRKLKDERYGSPACEVSLKLRKDAPTSEYRGMIVVGIEHPRIKSYFFGYNVTVLPDVDFITGNNAKLNDPVLKFSVVRLDPPVNTQRVLIIENKNPQVPYVPRNIRVEGMDAEIYSTELRTIDPGVKYEVVVTITTAPKGNGMMRSVLVIESDHPELPQKKIKISGTYSG